MAGIQWSTAPDHCQGENIKVVTCGQHPTQGCLSAKPLGCLTLPHQAGNKVLITQVAGKKENNNQTNVKIICEVLKIIWTKIV